MSEMPLDQSFIEAERGEKHSSNTVHFYLHPVKNERLTAEKGQEIYEDREYVLIISPGQRLSEVRRKATDMDKQQYARQYEAFLQKKAQPIVGTPLGNLPGLTPARVKEMEYLNIRTIQQLLDVPESALPKIGPDARQLQHQARAFLEKNDARVLTLEAAVKALETKLATLSAAPSQAQQPAKRRGRPRKKAVNGAHELPHGGSSSVS
jgi:hypothetical protein